MKRGSAKNYSWQKSGPTRRPDKSSAMPRRQSRVGLIALGVLLVLSVGIGLIIVFRTNGSPGSPTNQAIASRPSNVLPNTLSPTGQTAATRPPTNMPPVPSTTSPLEMDVSALQELMLDLINADRQTNGVSPVSQDEFAARIGTVHAQEMADNNYLSHWDMQGYGPDVRYSLAGGTDTVHENVYSYYLRFDDGRPAPIMDWGQVVRDAEKALMDSPGHRVNILNADHTHVGIGIAYNSQTGEVRIAQEFVNRYLSLSSLPQAIGLNDEIDLHGILLPGSSEPLINLAYEALPQPLTPDDLNNRMSHTYSSPAELYDSILPTITGNQFMTRLRLNVGNRIGLYHIRIWCKSNGRDVIAADIVVIVQ